MSPTDTIAAPLTAPGRAAVHVVRISGPDVRQAIARLTPRAARIIAAPRTMVSSPVLDLTKPEPERLDHGLVVFFPAPHSFTGEDCVELHLHGSPYLVERLLESLRTLGIRLARPGEFSQRAFLNGRMDLSQAEAVADLIAAETEGQARIAREQLEGRLSRALGELGEPVRELLALIEAHIDFPDEDIDPGSYKGWLESAAAVEECITRQLATYSAGKLYREGAMVVFSGVPNAGKSSLMNLLVGEDRAIVTPIPGTTRDAIEEHLSLGGLLVRCWDTAGLVEQSSESRIIDPVEQLGIERSWQKIAQADLLLFVIDAAQPLVPQLELTRSARSRAKLVLPVLNKADLLSPAQISTAAAEVEAALNRPPVMLSAVTRIGFETLKNEIVSTLLGTGVPRQAVLVSNQRHYEQLEHAAAAIARARALLSGQGPPELIALELRGYLSALSEIVGVTATEDILGMIFSKFCIGK